MPILLPVLDPEICDCLRAVIDPEIGINIVDLGLVLTAEHAPGRIEVKLTLTSRACPLGDMVLDDARAALAARFPSVPDVNVQLVWEPQWSQDFVTDRGFELLGLPRARILT